MISDPLSPVTFPGKKRLSVEDSEPINLFQKRNKRDEEVENFGPQSGHMNGFKSQRLSTSSSENQLGHKPQDHNNGRNGLTDSQVEQFQRYHESVVTSMKMEFQMAIERKSQELLQLNLTTGALIASLETHKKEELRLIEESKILKKAVTIQDGRNRELNVQNQQLQNVLQLAAEHIAKLEESNRQLMSQINNPQFMHFRPPDIC